MGHEHETLTALRCQQKGLHDARRRLTCERTLQFKHNVSQVMQNHTYKDRRKLKDSELVTFPYQDTQTKDLDLGHTPLELLLRRKPLWSHPQPLL
eukprot:3932015-Amphidinium_carterae.1